MSKRKDKKQRLNLRRVVSSPTRIEDQRHEVQPANQTNSLQRVPSPQVPWPAPRQISAGQGEYRFLNPYNFVRYLPPPKALSDTTDACLASDVQLLGRCSPPPHDRYVGLTGQIICTLEAITPLFISDSHAVVPHKVLVQTGERVREVEHKSYRFFQYDGEDAIPATSLRGMIRSVFEAVTNSPFTVFNSIDRLEYRLDPAEARRFLPGIVRSLPEGGQPGIIVLCEEAKIGAYYDDPTLNVLDCTWRCGEEAYAIIERTKNGVPKVERLERDRGAFTGDNRTIQRGWVKVTGKTIDSKRNESFFYFSGKPKEVTFDTEREDDFNAILHAQLHERSEDFHSQVQHERLTPGDLVYVELDPEDNKRVRNIALARVARLRYRNAIGDLLPDHLKPSDQYNQLDIASRLFGWVRDPYSRSRNSTDLSERVAYAGRLRFSNATLAEEGDKGVYQGELALAVLGAPKPTTTLFYLQKAEGSWSDAERKTPNAAETVGYDGPNVLRGRKFYRHHGRVLNRQEYERAGNKRDHQNRSVRGVRTPGNVFEFTVDFHNLAPVELGALLWVLQIAEEGCYHRLGYAKPLGFGSVRLKVEEVRLLDFKHRYSSFDKTGGWRRADFNERSGWLYRFERAMQCCYGQPIRQLDNIRDLFALLREPEASLPKHIHYPRQQRQPDPEGKNFAWFVANKRKSKQLHKAGPNHVLEHAAEERQGLPLLEEQ